jgi:hypothetical protein
MKRMLVLPNMNEIARQEAVSEIAGQTLKVFLKPAPLSYSFRILIVIFLKSEAMDNASN